MSVSGFAVQTCPAVAQAGFPVFPVLPLFLSFSPPGQRERKNSVCWAIDGRVLITVEAGGTLGGITVTDSKYDGFFGHNGCDTQGWPAR